MGTSSLIRLQSELENNLKSLAPAELGFGLLPKRGFLPAHKVEIKLPGSFSLGDTGISFLGSRLPQV